MSELKYQFDLLYKTGFGQYCLYDEEPDKNEIPASTYLASNSPRPEGDQAVQDARYSNFCKNMRNIFKRKVEEEKQFQKARKELIK
ncbi:MAG TPA: hypothetical protein ENN60_02300 [archaeon]|nr:hypothetical protein [archaeon]